MLDEPSGDSLRLRTTPFHYKLQLAFAGELPPAATTFRAVFTTQTALGKVRPGAGQSQAVSPDARLIVTFVEKRIFELANRGAERPQIQNVRITLMQYVS